MNYDTLDKLIPARRLPGDATEPREKLFDMLRHLDALRELRAGQPDPDPELDKQIKFYERILEGE